MVVVWWWWLWGGCRRTRSGELRGEGVARASGAEQRQAHRPDWAPGQRLHVVSGRRHVVAVAVARDDGERHGLARRHHRVLAGHALRRTSRGGGGEAPISAPPCLL